MEDLYKLNKNNNLIKFTLQNFEESTIVNKILKSIQFDFGNLE